MKPGPRFYALGYRLSWLFALQAAIGLGMVCSVIYATMAYTLAERQRDELAAKAEVMRHVLAEWPRTENLPAMRHKLDDILLGHGDLQVDMVSAGGTALYRGPRLDLQGAKSRSTLFTLARSGTTVDVSIAMDISGDERLLRALAWTLLLATVLGSSAVALGGFWIVRVGLAPLRELARQTAALAPERLDQRLSAPGHAEELQPWIGQLNGLLDRLQRAYRQLEGFNADVAHELRTPLATLISRSEVDLAQPRSNAQLRDAIGSNLEELQRLAGIVNDMLFVAQAERGAKARLDPADSLAELATRVIEYHEAALVEAGLRAVVDGDVVVAVDRRLIRRALSNLVGNATRFADPGTTIAVILRDEPGGTSISVHNEGPEIASDNLPRLFDRFFRTDHSRQQGDEHHGLGLAIVSAIARMHGGHTFAKCISGTTMIGLAIGRDCTTPSSDRPV